MRFRPNRRGPTVVAMAAFLLAISASIAPAQQAPPRPSTATPRVEPKPSPKTSRPKPVDDGPVVMSTEAYARSRGKLEEKGRYGAEPDWASLPPWKQTSFFGIKAEGQFFVYVVDCSGSMIDDDRLDRAKAELRRSVNALQSPQRFKVIFYNDAPIPMPGELPRSADYPSKSQLSRWLNLVEPGGETDPRGAISLGLALKPDAVFLLSDGAFPEGTAEAIARLNPKKVPIHCVDLANGTAGDDLKKIANESGGQYAARGR